MLDDLMELSPFTPEIGIHQPKSDRTSTISSIYNLNSPVIQCQS